MVYIPNGCNPARPKPPKHIKTIGLKTGSYILFVGRLTPEKGCHTLIEAFRQVQTDKHLVLAGQAMHDDAYARKLQELSGDCPRIHFTGFVQRDWLRELYSNAYFVVHPSVLEGLSVALLEAHSYGNCLLVSDIPENVEIIEEGSSTFRAGDTQDLREELQRLIDHPEQVHLARDTTAASPLWTWNQVGHATQEIYTQLMFGRS